MVVRGEGINPAGNEATNDRSAASPAGTPFRVDARGPISSVQNTDASLPVVARPGQVPQRRPQQEHLLVERRSFIHRSEGVGGDGTVPRLTAGEDDSGVGQEPTAPADKAVGDRSEPGDSPGSFSGLPKKIDLTAFLGKIKAGGGDLDTDFTHIVPLKDNYRLTHVIGEEEQRGPLLERVTVDERGIARSRDDVTGITTSLVAVRIQDHEATVVPFERDEHGLVLPLPGNTGSQIGFFISHDGGESHSTSAIIRQGDYPGIPLTTDKITDNLTGQERTREILINMGGIKKEESDEALWAEQVGLFDDLGFDPFRTRGIFSKSHRDNPNSTTWKNQRIIIVPDEMRDLVEHHDAWDVTKDLLQIMTYGTQRITRRLVRDHRITPDMFGGGFDNPGGAEKAMYAPRSLGVGFGNETTQQAKTTSIRTTELESVFQIRVAPREN